jgi:GxxExxY protein
MIAINSITAAIVDSAVRIHARFGPGMAEIIYEAILARDLAVRGFMVERQKQISFEFEGMLFENACRCDLLVERAVVVEIKSVARIIALHEQQLLTYLRLLDCRVGLILNFGAALMKDGIKRIANRA